MKALEKILVAATISIPLALIVVGTVGYLWERKK